MRVGSREQGAGSREQGAGGNYSPLHPSLCPGASSPYFDNAQAQYKCPMPNTPCPMPHSQLLNSVLTNGERAKWT
ncbi:Glycine/D-amino acid oxidase [Nostoc flagelliforme CCNUN1]|uniref:Glycine/D-amino acid oxidase n=1 Tax=Nostoc flagelliforme CCNUN1 TaxID=2038116 RepID=A0A2K8T2I1_9NOSO|nr:Glycine/D-amino acid oxidase [Nostoc flagelliforme CCNUN1]